MIEFILNSFIAGSAMKKEHDNRGSASELLRRLGLFTTRDALSAGISKPTLGRLVQRGVLQRFAHGIFIHSEAEWPDNLEFIVACMSLGPESVIGGLTALSYYAITEQVPSQTWLMIPNSKHGRYEKYRVLRTKHDPRVQVIDHGSWRIVSVERAIIEAFTYQTKIGYQTALSAARIALAEEKVTEASLANAAKHLGAWPLIVKSWEAITSK